MKGLDKLKKEPKPVLVKMAERLGIKVSVRWRRPELARKILEKQKLNELEEPAPQSTAETPETEGPKRKPEFEDLITESAESEPELPQEEKDGRGGAREGAGRTQGLTEEKARVQRILKNQVPDPFVQFVIETIFGLAGEPKKKTVEPTPDMIAIPATNLISYYFPNVHVTPVLQVWLDFGIGIKNLVMSNLESRKKAEPVAVPVESKDNGK